MAIGVGSSRKNITLPDAVWASLDAEAETERLRGGGRVERSEVILRYITEAQADQEARVERRLEQIGFDLEQLRDMVLALQETLTQQAELLRQMAAGVTMPTVQEDPMEWSTVPESRAEALRRHYQEHQAAESASDVADVPQDVAKSRWWRRG